MGMRSMDVAWAIERWDGEVAREMVRLIDAGHPPYEAAQLARDHVSERRRRALHPADPAGAGTVDDRRVRQRAKSS